MNTDEHRLEKSCRNVFSLLVVFFVLCCFSAFTFADETSQKIDALRKTDLRVIVLDGEGKPIENAAVKIEQLRHDFSIGFVLGEQGFPEFQGSGIPGAGAVWQCFNAVSLERLTAWSRVQPSPLAEPNFVEVDRAVEAAQRMGLRLRWGGMISADSGRNPDWIAFLEGPKLATALDDYVKRVMLRYGSHVDAFDLYTHSLDHHFIEDRLGTALLRQLHAHARAAAPRASISLRIENGLTETRLKKAIQHVRDMKQQFITFNQISVTQHIGGMLLQRQLSRGLDRLGQLGEDVIISSLEVGGSSEAAAANNLEALLRVLFATESIRGIYFSGLTVDEVADPNAALVDRTGRATRTGEAMARLFHEQWWTDEAHATDALGNVYARVFAGTHHITALLPDGSTLQTTVYLPIAPPDELPSHIVLLEPMKTLP